MGHEGTEGIGPTPVAGFAAFSTVRLSQPQLPFAAFPQPSAQIACPPCPRAPQRYFLA